MMTEDPMDDVYGTFTNCAGAVASPVSHEYGKLSIDDDGNSNNNTNSSNKRPSSWMMPSCTVNVTPLRKLIGGNHLGDHDRHHQELILPGNHPLQAKCKNLLRDLHLCSPPKATSKSKNSRSSRRRYSLGGRDKQENDDDPQPTSGEEDNIEQVYANVEVLLDALRMERHQEKLIAEFQINSLKEKIADLEKKVATNSKNKNDSPSNTTNSHSDNEDVIVSGEITETLFETLAILEQECEEWQSAKSSKKPRKSLDNITTSILNCTTNAATTTTKTSTPREQKIIDSIKRLKTMDFVEEEDRKLLDWYLDTSSENSNQTTVLIKNLRKKVKSLEQELIRKDLEMSKERAQLRQLIFQKDRDLKKLTAKLNKKDIVQANNTPTDADADADEKEKDKTPTLTPPKATATTTAQTRLEHVQEELQRKRNKLQKIKGVTQKEEGTNGEHVPGDEEATENNSKGNSNTPTVENKLTRTAGKGLEIKMNRQMKDLEKKMHSLQCELSGSQRKHSDVLMKLAVESTSKASLSIKLDAATAQIEKQKEAISFLNQELGQAKYDCKVYAQKVQELNHKVGLVLSAKMERETDAFESLHPTKNAGNDNH